MDIGCSVVNWCNIIGFEHIINQMGVPDTCNCTTMVNNINVQKERLPDVNDELLLLHRGHHRDNQMVLKRGWGLIVPGLREMFLVGMKEQFNLRIQSHFA